MAKFVWNRETGDFVESGSRVGRTIWRTVEVSCACGYHDEDEVVHVDDESLPPCPECGGEMTENTDFAAKVARISGQADFLPGGGYNVGGIHYDRRSDLQRDLARLGVQHGGQMELHNPSESQRRAEIDARRDKLEARRKAAGYSTEDVLRVDKERKAAKAAGAVNDPVLTKSAAQIIKGE